jgi:hypothetical protein
LQGVFTVIQSVIVGVVVGNVAVVVVVDVVVVAVAVVGVVVVAAVVTAEDEKVRVVALVVVSGTFEDVATVVVVGVTVVVAVVVVAAVVVIAVITSQFPLQHPQHTRCENAKTELIVTIISPSTLLFAVRFTSATLINDTSGGKELDGKLNTFPQLPFMNDVVHSPSKYRSV